MVNFSEMMLGQLLGRGVDRKVYEHRDNKNLVIKIERSGSIYKQNMREWLAWKQASEYNKTDWLAPCVRISSDCRVLIQKRTQPHTTIGSMLVPIWMEDTLKDNFGMLGGKLVSHDYARNSIAKYGLLTTDEKEITWG